MGKKEQKNEIEMNQSKTKAIMKEQSNKHLNSTNDSQTEFLVNNLGQEHSSQIKNQNKFEIINTVQVTIRPTLVVNDELNQARNQRAPRIRQRQLRLTEMGITSSRKHKEFVKKCMQCQKKLKTQKSKLKGRGPICNQKHLRRTQQH